MRGGVAAVGSETDLDGIVFFYREIVRGWLTHFIVVGQHHDAVVRLAQLQLVLGAYHALRHLTADLAFLDGDVLLADPQLSANGSYEHLLSSCHVGRTANDMQRLFAAAIDGGDMEVV